MRPAETAIEIIKEHLAYLERVYQSPFNYFYFLTKDDFSLKELSYAKWVTSEIITLLEQDLDEPPLQILEDMRDKTYVYSLKGKKADPIFKTAYETVDDIIDLLIKS